MEPGGLGGLDWPPSPAEYTTRSPSYTDSGRSYMGTIVGSKGQVVIEQRIREALGVQPGARAVQHLVGDHVEIHFLPPPHSRSLKGILGPLITRRPVGDLDETEPAWEGSAARHRPEVSPA